MLLRMHPDVGVRCKLESLAQPLKCPQFGLDRCLLAFETGGGRIKHCFQPVALPVCDRERREQLPDHSTAEACAKQLLNLQHDADVFGCIDPMPSCRSLRRKESLLFVVTKRSHTHVTPS